MAGDPADAPAKLAAKTSKLRIFRDDAGRMNRSLLDTNGSALVVSQFTLAADTRRGNRPGFSSAAAPEEGEARYLEYVSAMEDLGIPVATGVFGADMSVSLVNDGPITIWLDTET
jgi:D-tyrosyl-tRNA(Tyr) deacylase